MSEIDEAGSKFQGDSPWFAEGTVYKGMSFGEDTAFCIRAMSVGIPIHVHTGAKIGHVKPQIMDEAAYKRFRTRLKDEGTESFASTLTQKLGAVSI